MPRTTRLLALGALVLGLSQVVVVHADPVPDRVTHGSVGIERFYGYRCGAAFTYHFTGTFLVGKRVWHGTASATSCAYALPDATGLPYVTELVLLGSSADGLLYAPCQTNATFAADLWSYAPNDPAALLCTASIDGGLPQPLAFEMKTHSVGSDRYEGSFYGA